MRPGRQLIWRSTSFELLDCPAAPCLLPLEGATNASSLSLVGEAELHRAAGPERHTDQDHEETAYLRKRSRAPIRRDCHAGRHEARSRNLARRACPRRPGLVGMADLRSSPRECDDRSTVAPTGQGVNPRLLVGDGRLALPGSHGRSFCSGMNPSHERDYGRITMKISEISQSRRHSQNCACSIVLGTAWPAPGDRREQSAPSL
jgi:hypothetical protein